MMRRPGKLRMNESGAEIALTIAVNAALNGFGQFVSGQRGKCAEIWRDN
jgi:hypothetical protein